MRKFIALNLLILIVLSNVLLSTASFGKSSLAEDPSPSPTASPTPEPTPTPEPEENYQIYVVAKFGDENIAGMTFQLSGNGVSKNLPSTNTNTVFNDLSAGSYTIIINIPTSSEYELSSSSNSKVVTLSSTNQEETVTFLLQKKAPETDENLDSIQDINLPAELTKVGSSTTDITKIDPERLSYVENFTFDNPGVNKIVYKQALDLSDFEEYSRINEIGSYIDLENYGTIQFNTEPFQVFNQPAKLTMYKIRLVEFESADESGDESGGEEEEPVAIILKDGQEFEPINLNYSGNELSFEVEGFSTYKLSPRLKLKLDESDGITAEDLDEETDTDEESTDSNESSNNDIYTTEKETIEVKFMVDNLDAKITASNDGQVVNFPEEPNDEGMVTGEIKLKSGSNRIRLTAEIPNGEKVDKFFTIKFSTEEDNNVSQVFSILFFLLILGAGVGIVAFYLYKQKKLKIGIFAKDKGKKSKEGKNLENKKATEAKSKYDPNLLTEEEKRIYEGSEESTGNQPA